MRREERVDELLNNALGVREMMLKESRMVKQGAMKEEKLGGHL